MTGRFCQGRIAARHFGHRDGGNTIDSPRGRRWMTTFAKLPTIRPKGKLVRAATKATEVKRPDMVSGSELSFRLTLDPGYSKLSFRC